MSALTQGLWPAMPALWKIHGPTSLQRRPWASGNFLFPSGTGRSPFSVTASLALGRVWTTEVLHGGTLLLTILAFHTWTSVLGAFQADPGFCLLGWFWGLWMLFKADASWWVCCLIGYLPCWSTLSCNHGYIIKHLKFYFLSSGSWDFGVPWRGSETVPLGVSPQEWIQNLQLKVCRTGKDRGWHGGFKFSEA